MRHEHRIGPFRNRHLLREVGRLDRGDVVGRGELVRIGSGTAGRRDDAKARLVGKRGD